MRSVLSLLPLVALAVPAIAVTEYSIVDLYKGESFFDGFSFFTADDPTNGYVDYVDRKSAEALKIASSSADSVRFGVDSSETIASTARGRKSVRIQTDKTWSYGLFIADIAHMPGNACGIWPAFWLLGEGQWPANGEIDIIEGVNNNTMNEFVLHTGDDCLVSSAGSGLLVEDNCSVNHSTVGCVVKDKRPESFGDGFNTNKGGIYALEWTDEALQIWFFPRNAIPASISSGTPSPSADFGTPQARIGNPSCDVTKHFTAQKIIFNTALCGDWAGNEFFNDGCPASGNLDKFGSCQAYVANNPSAFTEAYWEVNSLSVFQLAEGGSGSSSSSSSTAVTSTTTSASASTTSSTTTSSSSTTSSTTISSSSSSTKSSIVTTSPTPYYPTGTGAYYPTTGSGTGTGTGTGVVSLPSTTCDDDETSTSHVSGAATTIYGTDATTTIYEENCSSSSYDDTATSPNTAATPTGVENGMSLPPAILSSIRMHQSTGSSYQYNDTAPTPTAPSVIVSTDSSSTGELDSTYGYPTPSTESDYTTTTSADVLPSTIIGASTESGYSFATTTSPAVIGTGTNSASSITGRPTSASEFDGGASFPTPGIPALIGAVLFGAIML